MGAHINHQERHKMRALDTARVMTVTLAALVWACAPTVQTIKRTKLEGQPRIDQDGLSTIKPADARGNVYDVVGKDEQNQWRVTEPNEAAQAETAWTGVHLTANDPTNEKAAQLIRDIYARLD